MNCKKGDLAIVVRSDAGNEGRIVRCVRLLGLDIYADRRGRSRIVPSWEIDPPLFDWSGELGCDMADDQLRPIRDNDNPDEILTRIGKPEGITA